MPLFSLESKYHRGSIFTAESQLAHSIIHCHESLRSLHLPESMPNYGLDQHALVVIRYASFRVRSKNPDEPEILFVRLRPCSLLELDDNLAMLNFLQIVRDYGEGSFRQALKGVVARLEIPLAILHDDSAKDRQSRK